MDPCPLRFNYKRQTLSLISRLPSDSPYVALLHNATSTAELLQTLSSLLSKPELTLTIATLFRPLLLDLCARWLYDGGNKEDRLEALCLLLEIHPELFPYVVVLSRSYVELIFLQYTFNIFENSTLPCRIAGLCYICRRYREHTRFIPTSYSLSVLPNSSCL